MHHKLDHFYFLKIHSSAKRFDRFTKKEEINRNGQFSHEKRFLADRAKVPLNETHRHFTSRGRYCQRSNIVHIRERKLVI